MRKAVLNPNTLPVNKQDFQVEGFPGANRIIQRDSINIELGVIERPDKTVVPSGRTEPGEFNITLDAADNISRTGYYRWWAQAKDMYSGVNISQQDGDMGPDNYSYTYGNYNNSTAYTSPSNRPGINGDYKRKAVITMYRLYKEADTGNSVQFEAADNVPVRIVLHGCWVKTIEFGEFDMESDEALTVTCGISYDDAQMIVS